MKKLLDALMARLYRKPLYRVLLAVLGFPTFLAALVVYQMRKKRTGQQEDTLRREVLAQLENSPELKELEEEIEASVRSRVAFFHLKQSEEQIRRMVEKQRALEYEALVEERVKALRRQRGLSSESYLDTLLSLMGLGGGRVILAVLSILMYALLLICYNPFVRYIFERIIMMVFVVFGVVFVVFTILHLSPMNPAVNVLGETATEQQIADFNRVYGLDQPYFTQLLSQFKKTITFDLGNSFSGNEVVFDALMRKFPVTLQLSVWAMLVAIVIALPVGIVSAIRPYTAYDYVFMFLTMVGLSLPAFWFGMVMILIFSINLGILPAGFSLDNPLSYVMPALVIGTTIAANLARMTRSSMLEVVNQDYIVTARAKGLSERAVILRHALGNAMIPIVTIIGLQFGSALGGSAVVEKVFNIKGIGSYIIEKQFLPDIPIILSGVVYVAVIISLVNLLVDLIYAVLDPRIKSKIRSS